MARSSMLVTALHQHLRSCCWSSGASLQVSAVESLPRSLEQRVEEPQARQVPHSSTAFVQSLLKTPSKRGQYPGLSVRRYGLHSVRASQRLFCFLLQVRHMDLPFSSRWRYSCEGSALNHAEALSRYRGSACLCFP